MKTTRRILSMVLALMMILSLSVTAFATEAPYIRVTVVASRSGNTDAWDVPATTDASVKAALDNDETHTKDWTTVADYTDATKTHYALNAYNGYAAAKFDSTVAADRSNLLKKGYNYKDITWYTGALQGYGLISHDETTGKYTYIYAGYDWTYSSNKSAQIWDYMCCYNVKADEIVQLVYDFNVTVWTTTTPIA